MQIELIVLLGGCVLGATHILLATRLKLRQYGEKWGLSARDESLPPPQLVLGRLMRAQDNFFETFPIVVGGIAMVVITGIHSPWTGIGALTWLVARVIFLGLYAAGIPTVRTISFIFSVAGILMLFAPLFHAAFHGLLPIS